MLLWQGLERFFVSGSIPLLEQALRVLRGLPMRVDELDWPEIGLSIWIIRRVIGGLLTAFCE